MSAPVYTIDYNEDADDHPPFLVWRDGDLLERFFSLPAAARYVAMCREDDSKAAPPPPQKQLHLEGTE